MPAPEGPASDSRTPSVDLVVNTFERTYRDALRPERFDEIVTDNPYPFARRVALINNVNDVADARARARACVDADALDAYFFVRDLLPQALARTGLERRDLGRIPHFSDCAVTAVSLDGPEWILYWDAELRLRPAADWITPAIDLMERDRRILVANPSWPAATLERETFESQGEFALGYGFSDLAFLARRRELAAPIYRQRCVARLRYPLAHVAHIFESRVDAYMRHAGRLRATYRGAVMSYPSHSMGTAYPPLTSRERLRYARNRVVTALLYRSPLRPACCRYI